MLMVGVVAVVLRWHHVVLLCCPAGGRATMEVVAVLVEEVGIVVCEVTRNPFHESSAIQPLYEHLLYMEGKAANPARILMHQPFHSLHSFTSARTRSLNLVRSFALQHEPAAMLSTSCLEPCSGHTPSGPPSCPVRR